ncbi:MAG: ImmA/IrrE family metallo-endopeptidase [Candidatus Dojkabacteria bacterium]
MLINESQIQWIELKADDMLADTYGSIGKVSVPVDVHKVADHLGLKVQTGDISKDDVSSIFQKDENRIITQRSDASSRQNFSIAHQIGHFVLHKDKEEDVFYREEATNLDKAEKKEEQEANVFAAALLMPEFFVKRLWAQFPDVLIIADAFKVSQVAAYFRLKNLKLTE